MTQMTRAMVLACGLSLTASQAALAQENTLGRWFFDVNAAVQTPGRDLQENGTFPLYDEDITVSGTRKVGSGLVVDGGAGMHLSRRFAVGLSYSWFSASSDVTFTASVPHPLFADRPRSATGTVDNLNRTEHSVHLTAMWRFDLLEGVDLKVGGGPSFFYVSEEGLASATATESGPPWETVSVGFTTATRSANGFGFNVGGDLTYMFTERLGAGALFRYTWGSVTLPMPGGEERDSNGAGGIHLGGGLRLRF